MTLEEIMQRDWDQCHADDKREAPKIIRRKTRKEWNQHYTHDAMGTNPRETVWHNICEVICGILALLVFGFFCWLCCAASGYHFE